jgi:hypothetical protein
MAPLPMSVIRQPPRYDRLGGTDERTLIATTAPALKHPDSNYAETTMHHSSNPLNGWVKS